MPRRSALADDLERYRNGETILARRTPVLERGIKWARRRPAAAAMLCLGLARSLSIDLGCLDTSHAGAAKRSCHRTLARRRPS